MLIIPFLVKSNTKVLHFLNPNAFFHNFIQKKATAIAAGIARRRGSNPTKMRGLLQTTLVFTQMPHPYLRIS